MTCSGANSAQLVIWSRRLEILFWQLAAEHSMLRVLILSASVWAYFLRSAIGLLAGATLCAKSLRAHFHAHNTQTVHTSQSVCVCLLASITLPQAWRSQVSAKRPHISARERFLSRTWRPISQSPISLSQHQFKSVKSAARLHSSIYFAPLLT